jgi:hypothetical protein
MCSLLQVRIAAYPTGVYRDLPLLGDHAIYGDAYSAGKGCDAKK